MPKRSGFIKSASRLISGKNRNVVLAGALGAILLLTGVFSIVFRSETSPTDLQAVNDSDNGQEVTEIDTAEPMEATLTVNDGTVEYKTEDEWLPAEDNMMIVSGMSIRTIGAASRAAIELADKTTIRIDASSEIMFETLSESRVVVNQQSGHVYSRVSASGTRTYVVQSENAQYQSLGTAFRTSATGDEESVEVFHSNVKEVVNNLQAGQGEKIIVRSFTNPDLDKTVEKLNLQNIKEDRFITWNREQDQANDDYKNLLGFLSDYDGPSLTITEPAANSSISVSSEKNEGVVQIKGNTESTASLTVRSKSLPGSTAVDVNVNDDGGFVTPELKGPLGTSVFEFVATDTVGNKTWRTVSYSFKQETTTQEQGIVLTANNDDPSELVLNWGLVGMTTPDGVYILSSTKEGLSFANKRSLITSGTSASESKPTIEMHYAVCRYDADTDTCDVFSNEVTVTP